MNKRIVVLAIVFILLASFLVAKSLTKVPYGVHVRCQDGKCYAFLTTGRLNLWYEFCRRVDLAVKHLTGTLGK